MKQTWKRMLGVLLVMALVIPSLTTAVSALSTGGAELSADAAVKLSNDIWDEIFEIEGRLESEKAADKAIVDKLYEFVQNHAEVEMAKRESDYHFYFETVGGIPCTYDRRIEMKMESGEAPAPIDTEALEDLLGGKDTTPATNLNIGVYSPYYGDDPSMTLNYLEAAQGVQEVLGEDVCSVSSFYGAEGNIESFKRFDEFGVVLVDSHGTASGGKSWICVPFPGAYDSADFAEGNLLNGGSWIGVTGTFFEKYCDELDNTVVYLGICEGMKTDGLSTPILRHGGGFVMGYTESVTFYYDGLMMPTIHELFVTESPADPSRYYTVEEACEKAKEIHGPVDTYGDAVLIWDGDGDIVLQSEPTPATGVEIVPAVVNDLYVNNTAQLGVTTTPENANNYTLEWSSSNTAVATVDGAGLVTGVAQGTATITVTLRDNLEGGVYTATATVNVPGPLAVTGISLNPTVMGIYTNALPVEIAATIEPENASNKQIVWTTSDPSVATVDSGFVTGVSAGTAVITATTVDGNFAASCEVTVSELESLDDALNVTGGSLAFANDPTYPWTAVVLGSRGVAESTNQSESDSSATITSVVEMEAGDLLRFDWKVSSEPNYDKLIFAVNGTAQNNISGLVDWDTYYYRADTAGTYTFTWTYSKDGSVDRNDDVGWVDNVEYVDASEHIYTLTFAAGANGTLTGETSVEVPLGTTLTADMVPTPVPDEGYMLGGWNPFNPVGYFVEEDVDFTANFVDSSSSAMITLNVGTVWQDGSGYQMLLDADANAFETGVIPAEGGLTTGGDAPASVYAEFEYKIPENADGALNTQNMLVDNTSATISVPAGTYDYCITNPTPGDRIWIANSSNGSMGRADDYVLEAGKHYIFTIGTTVIGTSTYDFVTITVEGETPDPTPTPGQSDMIFGEYFEEDPTDWSLVDADGDGFDWHWFTNEGLTTGLMDAYEGMGIMASASYSNDLERPLTPDNYLISPDINVPANAVEAYLSWYAAAQDPDWSAEKYSVLVGPAGSTNPADFTDVIHTETLASDAWVNRTADLTDYAGETVRIAFRHHGVTDMFEIKLDQVEVFAEVGEQPTPTPEQPTPTPGQSDMIFGEYFEEDPTDWSLVDADGDGFDWHWFTNEGLTTGLMDAYEGMGIMASASYSNDLERPLTPDNYLISPDINVPANAVEAYLSWYAAAQDPDWSAEKYSVLVGPAGSTNPADFTDVIHTETLASDAWVNRTADLTDYAGETVRIAFRHHGVTDMFEIKLDQVEVFAEVGEQPTPTPEQPTPTPEQPTPTPEQPTPTPEQPTPTPEQPTPTPEQPTPTPEPEDPPKAGGVSLVLIGVAAATLGSIGFIAKWKRG